MAIVDLVMPKLGESIMEATILKWHKNPGDQVKMDEINEFLIPFIKGYSLILFKQP